jgi:hypothetical protein
MKSANPCANARWRGAGAASVTTAVEADQMIMFGEYSLTKYFAEVVVLFCSNCFIREGLNKLPAISRAWCSNSSFTLMTNKHRNLGKLIEKTIKSHTIM